MNNNRLDAVLDRNRKHIVLDLVGAAFLVLVMLFSSLAFGAELPVLSSSGAAQLASAPVRTDLVVGSATTAVTAAIDEHVAQR
jgi:multisubunit Na+/H+ antiporter MnhC subunit